MPIAAVAKVLAAERKDIWRSDARSKKKGGGAGKRCRSLRV